MLETTSLRLDAVFADIRHASNKRMGGRTMVALVVILDEPLPIGTQLHVPYMIELELVLEIKLFQDWLFIGSIELVVPFDVWVSCLEVRPHEANLVHVDVDW